MVMKKWVDYNNIELFWNDELGQFYGEKYDGTVRHYIWLEDNTSLGLKLELARGYSLGGIACWKLGLEDAAVWDVINY